MLNAEQPFTDEVTTGRFIVVFDIDGDDFDAPALLSECGLGDVADSRDFSTAAEGSVAAAGTDTYFAELGIAVVSADPERLGMLRSVAAGRQRPVAVSPELMHHVLAPAHAESRGQTRTRGRRAAAAAPDSPTAVPTNFEDNDAFTWGLQATLAAESAYSGQGIRVAVLDTGFDTSHPDFAGRTVVAKSFVDGEDATDGHGHGTHCIGSACGPRAPEGSRGYGVAHEADIYSGKVLGASGSGTDATILAGIDWAVGNGCAIVSMSLGADVAQIHPPYVAAGQRALAKGTLIIAAAGNNANRSVGDFGFVGAPANSPYIMAVGALDGTLEMADFSARTLPGRGGQVDVAGPGVEIHSSWPMPERYRSISGTSMATPHAAGVAALLAEATGLRGRELWAEVVQEARRLESASVDVGAGLVQAPPPADPSLPNTSGMRARVAEPLPGQG